MYGQRWKVVLLHHMEEFKGNAWVVEDRYGSWLIHCTGSICDYGCR